MTSLPGMTFQGPERAPVRPIDWLTCWSEEAEAMPCKAASRAPSIYPTTNWIRTTGLWQRRPTETWSFSVGAVHGSARGVLTQSPGLSVRDYCTSSEARST